MFLAMLAAAPILVGGTEYQSALERAERYESDAAASDYRMAKFYPVAGQKIAEALDRCVKGGSDDPFTIIVSLRADGGVDGVYIDRETKHSRCVAAEMSKLKAPKPPHPDFAEQMSFSFEPDRE